VESPDIFCAMSQAAWNRFSFLMKQGTVLYDPETVSFPPESIVEKPSRFVRLAIPAGATAEAIGSRQFANAVFVGAIIKKLDSVPLERAKRAIQKIVPRLTEENIQALEEGYRYSFK
jgi:Pyruvate/2-oxoacid:ferredoxin oxidoreductase gamma subunit